MTLLLLLLSPLALRGRLHLSLPLTWQLPQAWAPVAMLPEPGTGLTHSRHSVLTERCQGWLYERVSAQERREVSVRVCAPPYCFPACPSPASHTSLYPPLFLMFRVDKGSWNTGLPSLYPASPASGPHIPMAARLPWQ